MTEEENWYEGVPQPVDADGNVVPLATRTLYDGDGQEISVMEYALIYSKYTGAQVWHARKTNGSTFMLDRLHLERPDTWDELIADVERSCRAGGGRPFVCGYWGDTAHMPCGGDACTPFGTNEARCICGIIRDILRRIKALRKAERDGD